MIGTYALDGNQRARMRYLEQLKPFITEARYRQYDTEIREDESTLPAVLVMDGTQKQNGKIEIINYPKAIMNALASGRAKTRIDIMRACRNRHLQQLEAKDEDDKQRREYKEQARKDHLSLFLSSLRLLQEAGQIEEVDGKFRRVKHA